MRVGIAGASGYAGMELVRLLAAHPHFEVAVATGHATQGEAIASHSPSLTGAVGAMTYQATTASAFTGLDLVFLALPHGASQDIVPELIDQGITVIDLGADYRLHPEGYQRWYGEQHRSPELCEGAVYGLVERNRQQLFGASLVAVPGCYPTATNLGLAPFADAASIDLSDVIVDAASGVSGAGRAPTARLHFGAADEDVSAYGLLDHRHTAEMELVLGARVLFTPHLVPMIRGMLATIYARPVDGLRTEDAMAILHDAYDAEHFIHVVDVPPSTKWASGSNAVFVTARVDQRTGRLLVLSAIDNLGKGAAGQALQCANAVVGIDEAAGLSNVGVYP